MYFVHIAVYVLRVVVFYVVHIVVIFSNLSVHNVVFIFHVFLHDLRPSGLLVGQLDRVTFLESVSTSDHRPHILPLEGLWMTENHTDTTVLKCGIIPKAEGVHIYFNFVQSYDLHEFRLTQMK